MPGIPRMYLNTEYFHVITQGINKSYIFDDSVDIKFYIKNIYELQNKYNVKVIAYCIMMLVVKRGKEVSPIIYGVAIFFIINYLLKVIL